MNGRRLVLLVGLIALAFAAVPATASALCNGMTATVGGATGGNDVLTGTAGADVIDGQGEMTRINGGAGNDTICGDDGDDTINGEGGDDHLEGGTAGETAGDTVTFLGTTNGVSANLSTGVATTFTTLETDSMTGFEDLTGSNGFDVLTGDNGNNVIRGLVLADGFEGLGGDDTLIDDVGGVSDRDGPGSTRPAGPGGITGSLTTGTVTGDGVGTDTLTGFRGIEGSSFDDVLIGDNDDVPDFEHDRQRSYGDGRQRCSRTAPRDRLRGRRERDRPRHLCARHRDQPQPERRDGHNHPC